MRSLIFDYIHELTDFFGFHVCKIRLKYRLRSQLARASLVGIRDNRAYGECFIRAIFVSSILQCCYLRDKLRDFKVTPFGYLSCATCAVILLMVPGIDRCRKILMRLAARTTENENF